MMLTMSQIRLLSKFNLKLSSAGAETFGRNTLMSFHRLHYFKLYRCLSTKLSHFSITAPIFYVNSEPHLGHLYTAVICDVHSRWKSQCGKQTTFTVGTDEHGIKIQQAAQKNGIPLQHHCDIVSEKFKVLFHEGNIAYTDFIRTTERRHIAAVQAFWKTLCDRHLIYKGRYEGWYSVADEAFLTDADVHDHVDPHGNTTRVSSMSGHPVEWISEANYMFRLSDFANEIGRWLDTNVIKPPKFEAEVRAWLREGLPDLSVSRDRTRLPWGIPVPDDESQTIYVWLDALVNYLTVTGYPQPTFSWPPDCQVIGKDILKFHAVYWPAFLLAAGLPLPKSILCHSHWLHDGHKMSKTLGNVVDPISRLQNWSTDAMRYFLMKEGVPHSDANYLDSKVVAYVNAELVNTLANLLSRCTSRAVNPHQIYPHFDREIFAEKFDVKDQRVFYELPTMIENISRDYDDFNTHKVINTTMSKLRWANTLIQKHQPWYLAKSPDSTLELNTLLRVAMETLRVCGILMSPIIPETSEKLRKRLGVTPTNWDVNVGLDRQFLSSSHKLGVMNGNLHDRIKLGDVMQPLQVVKI